MHLIILSPSRRLYNRGIALKYCKYFYINFFGKRRISLSSKTLTAPWNVLFFGTDSFSVQSLEKLNENRLHGKPKVVGNLDVVSIPRKTTYLPVHRYATDNNLVLYEWPYNVPHHKYDLGVVASFGHLLPEDTINSFPFGIINVHGSLLPRWRGSAPIVHAILNGDKETGATIMQIAPHRYDIGNIVIQRAFGVPKHEMTAALTQKVGQTGATLLIECLQDLENLLEHSISQDSSKVTNAPKIKPEKAMILWHQHTCQDIDRLYRALDDSYKVYTYWHGHLTRLTNMVDYEDTSRNIPPEYNLNILQDLRPGKVVHRRCRKTLFILCKDGWIEFKTAIIKGKAKMTAQEFYNGYISKVKPDLQFFSIDKSE